MITTDPQVLAAPAARRVLAIMAERGIPVRRLPDCEATADEPPGVLGRLGVVPGLERVPARYRTAEADHPQVRAWVETTVTAAGRQAGGAMSIAGARSLLIVGPTGAGKTYQAYGAIRGLTAAGLRLGWQATTAADLYAALRPQPGGDSERLLAALARCPLLLLDDLGAARASEWTEEITYRLINHRYAQLLPMLITSNVPIGQLRPLLGDRVTSRLAEMTDRVVLQGPDRRRHPAAT